MPPPLPVCIAWSPSDRSGMPASPGLAPAPEARARGLAQSRFRPLSGHRQTNASPSLQGRDGWPASSEMSAPLGRRGGAAGPETRSARKAALLVEAVRGGAMDGGDFPQALHPPEPEHGPLRASERQARFLGPVVESPSGFLAMRGAGDAPKPEAPQDAPAAADPAPRARRLTRRAAPCPAR